jgi:hypothetical protein
MTIGRDAITAACYKPRRPESDVFRRFSMRIRHAWFVAALSVGLVVSGCSKGGGGSSGGATSSEDLGLLPADSEVVVGINFAQVQASSLYKQFSPKLVEKLAKELGDVKAACGFDPLESL